MLFVYQYSDVYIDIVMSFIYQVDEFVARTSAFYNPISVVRHVNRGGQYKGCQTD